VVAGGSRAARDYLAGQEVALLAQRPVTERLVRPLVRLGIVTLGELAALPRDAVADRFGPDGLLAWRLAHGEDSPPVPRSPRQSMRVSFELDESASGPALERALGVLIDRLLAHPRRRGRPLRTAVLSARLVEGGTWRERVVFRLALADPTRMRLVLAGRLALLPSPASELSLSAEELAPCGAETEPLLQDSAAARRARLREAVDQARSAAGPDAALRVVCIDPDSRVPERRAMLAPFALPGGGPSPRGSSPAPPGKGR
jgi:protein ImuB